MDEQPTRRILNRPVAVVLAGAALMLAGLVVLGLLSHRPEEEATPEAQPGAVGLGQKHMLWAGHVRRQPSWQGTWIAPDGATGYTVYISTPCPAPVCLFPTCLVGDASVAHCATCQGGTGTYNADAGTCTCTNDAGQPTCVSGQIGPSDIDAGRCSSPALCCVAYPGAPAPPGQRDGIIISRCFATSTPDGGAIQTDGGRCCVHGSCWYPPPNFPLDGGGVGHPDGQAPYSGTCWEYLYIEHPYVFDVETKH